MMSDKLETKEVKYLSFFVAIKPYGVIDAINRVAAATGHFSHAIAASAADFNGHHITVGWNDYRQYYIAEYYWGQRNVIRRGSVADAIWYAIDEWRRQGKGATVTISVKEQDLEEAMKTFAEFPDVVVSAGKEQWPPAWWTWKHAEVSNALNFERQLGCPYTSFLLKAETKEQYDAMVQEFFDIRHGKKAIKLTGITAQPQPQ